jgi:two-component system, chemotaxis family, response regulator Rcp1
MPNTMTEHVSVSHCRRIDVQHFRENRRNCAKTRGIGDGPVARSVLVIDDDETDVMFLREAFEAQNGEVVAVYHATSGDEGLALMRSTRPDLVLLDLKMPGTSGQEVLSAIRVDGALKRSKVIVFSSSKSRVDIREAYESAANAYISKPSTMSGYLDVARSLCQLWLDKVLSAT